MGPAVRHTVPRVGVVIDGEVGKDEHPAPGADWEREREARKGSERSERESNGGRARIRAVWLGIARRPVRRPTRRVCVVDVWEGD